MGAVACSAVGGGKRRERREEIAKEVGEDEPLLKITARAGHLHSACNSDFASVSRIPGRDKNGMETGRAREGQPC